MFPLRLFAFALFAIVVAISPGSHPALAQEKKAAENVMRQVTFGLGFFMGVIRGQSPSGSIREVIITGNTALGAKSAEQNQAMTKTCLAVSRAAGAEMKGLNAGAK